MKDIRKEGVIALKLWSLEKQVDDLIKENQKLKKQLEEYKKWYQDALEENSTFSQLWCDSRARIAELENQQKGFIEWLKKMINNLDNDINKINGLSENSKCEKERFTIKYNFLIQINEKYKEIIGVEDDRN